MRVNLEGEPLSKGVTEIEVEEGLIISKGDQPNCIYLDIEDELDIHQVKRLIKGLELAVKEMLENE